MHTRILEEDLITRRRTNWHTDARGNVVLESIQDVAPIMEFAATERSLYDERAPWKGDLHQVASIPPVVWEDLERRGIAQDDAALRAWLDDRDNFLWRTRPGRLSR